MAKYTILFSEYIEDGGALPSAFDTITGFSDLFKLKYYDRETGFETVPQFVMKLELYAQLYVPIYKARIDDLDAAIVRARACKRVTTTIGQGRQDNGEQNASSTELPFNSTTGTPTGKTHVDANNVQTSSSSTVTDIDDGASSVYLEIERLERKVKVLKNELLNEFEPLFMGVL